MSDLNPSHIFNDFKSDKIDRISAINYMKAIIENMDDDSLRVEALKYIYQIEGKSGDLYLFLENILVSDSSERIRAIAAIVIIEDFLEKGLNVLKWVIEHENSMMCLEAVYRSSNIEKSKKSLKLIKFLEKTIEKRFSNLEYYEREEIGLGHLERLMDKVQDYLLDKAYYSELSLETLLGEFEVLLRDPDFKHKKIKYALILKNFGDIFSEPVPNEDGQREKDLDLLIRATKLGLEIDAQNEELLHNLDYAYEQKRELIKVKEE